MADAARATRLAQRIKVIVAGSLNRVVRDEAIENVTITDARLTADLQNATVYYTVLGDEATKAEVADLLARNTGRLRKEVGRNITARLTPTLKFVPDEVPMNATHVEDLIRRAHEQDEAVAALAQGKEYAAGEDPYRHDDEGEDESAQAGDAPDSPAR